MSTVIYVSGGGKQNIRLSHLNQHIAVNCKYQLRYEVFRTCKSICCFKTYSIWQKKLKITCFRVYSFLEYCIHLYENFAKQPFSEYMYYNIIEYYVIRRSISVLCVENEYGRTLKQFFQTLMCIEVE